MIHQALVIGSGPGGLATVASLLDHGLEDIAWVDDQWCGGRLNGMYREISSLVPPTLDQGWHGCLAVILTVQQYQSGHLPRRHFFIYHMQEYH